MNYNTDINIIGSIPDYNLIYKAIEKHAIQGGELEKSIITDNEFDFRTEKSRKRFVSALYSAFLTFKTPHHQALLENIFKSDTSLFTKQLVLFWQFSIVNTLFFVINNNVFIKNYFSGRVLFPKENIEAYIKEIISNHPELKDKWSKLTIETIASKYLTILKKLDLVEGSVKKNFKHLQITNEALLIFINLVLAVEPECSNFFDAKLFPLCFVSKENFLIRAKELAGKDLIELSFNGTSLKITSKIKNLGQ